MRSHRALPMFDPPEGVVIAAATDRRFPRGVADPAAMRAFVHDRVGSVLALFFSQAEDGIRALYVTGVQTCALPISLRPFTATPITSGSEGKAEVNVAM